MTSPSKSIPTSPRTASRLRGLFIDGVWYFYTCQQHYPNKCDFFLWATDAEVREKHLVLANSRSERDESTGVDSSIRTPSKTPASRGMNSSNNNSGLLTPTTERSVRFLDRTPSKSKLMPDSEWGVRLRSQRQGQGQDMGIGMTAEDPGLLSLLARSPGNGDVGNDDNYDGEEQDDEIERYLNARSERRQQRRPQQQQQQTPTRNYRQQRLTFPLELSPVHTPRKAPRTTSITSPGKRNLENDDGKERGNGHTDGEKADDPFVSSTTTTPSHPKDKNSNNITPAITPSKTPHHHHPPQSSSPDTDNNNNNNSFTSFSFNSPPPASLEISTSPTPTKTKYTNILQQPSFSSFPPSSSQPSSSQDMSSSQTETAQAQGEAQDQAHSNLTRETLSLLESHHVVLPPTAQNELIELLNRCELRTKGIMRGRDITRLALKKKEERIRELERLIGI